jgi:hypothetical protein
MLLKHFSTADLRLRLTARIQIMNTLCGKASTVLVKSPLDAIDRECMNAAHCYVRLLLHQDHVRSHSVIKTIFGQV